MFRTPITLEGVLNRLLTDGVDFTYKDFTPDIDYHNQKLFVVIDRSSSVLLTAEEWVQKVKNFLSTIPNIDDGFHQKCGVVVKWKQAPGVFNISPTNLYTSGIVEY